MILEVWGLGLVWEHVLLGAQGVGLSRGPHLLLEESLPTGLHTGSCLCSQGLGELAQLVPCSLVPAACDAASAVTVTSSTMVSTYPGTGKTCCHDSRSFAMPGGSSLLWTARLAAGAATGWARPALRMPGCTGSCSAWLLAAALAASRPQQAVQQKAVD